MYEYYVYLGRPDALFYSNAEGSRQPEDSRQCNQQSAARYPDQNDFLKGDHV